MIEAPASKSCSHATALSVGALTEGIRSRPLTWLNLVCLDAPLVAVSWASLFAATYHASLTRGGLGALFLTSWLIYLADRFGDSGSIPPAAPRSLRQQFCRQHQRAWMAALGLVAALDAVIVYTQLDARQLKSGAGIGACAVVYLAVNRFAPTIWRSLPLKEISIGFLFASGTLVPLTGSLRTPFSAEWLLFLLLCSMNCIGIAIWESGLDSAQQRISIATEFPGLTAIVLPILSACLLAAGYSYIWLHTRQLSLAIAASAALLALVHLCRRRLQPDSRTALADLVLLTPIVVLAFG